MVLWVLCPQRPGPVLLKQSSDGCEERPVLVALEVLPWLALEVSGHGVTLKSVLSMTVTLIWWTVGVFEVLEIPESASSPL